MLWLALDSGWVAKHFWLSLYVQGKKKFMWKSEANTRHGLHLNLVTMTTFSSPISGEKQLDAQEWQKTSYE